MKKTAVLSGLMALTLLLGGCSAQQAGGETTDLMMVDKAMI